MPLIYSGQEYDMNYRLEFFGKDTIPKTKGKMWPLLEKLGNLKNNEAALEGGKNSATYERIKTSNDTSVLAFKRTKDGNNLIFVANLSPNPIKFSYPVSGPFMDVMKNQTIDIVENEEHQFAPWQYLILRKE